MASFREHPDASCSARANAKFECRVSPICIAGDRAAMPVMSVFETYRAICRAYGFLTKPSGLSDAPFPTIVIVVLKSRRERKSDVKQLGEC